LLSLLKERGWATGLSAGVGDGGYDHSSAGYMFSVNIWLTDSGLEHVSPWAIVFVLNVYFCKIFPSYKYNFLDRIFFVFPCIKYNPLFGSMNIFL